MEEEEREKRFFYEERGGRDFSHLLPTVDSQSENVRLNDLPFSHELD